MFHFRLRELIAEMERQLGERRSLRDVSEATGISAQVLSSLNSPTRRVVTTTASVEALCRYFRCTPNDLLVFSPELDDETVSSNVDDLYPDRRRP